MLVSSHVLHEVQSLTPTIVLLHRGRLVAEGNVREIRDLIDKHPHRIVLVCDKSRELAARLAGWDDVTALSFTTKNRGYWSRRGSPTPFTPACRRSWPATDRRLREVYSDDDNLEAVFKYLVNQ